MYLPPSCIRAGLRLALLLALLWVVGVRELRAGEVQVAEATVSWDTDLERLGRDAAQALPTVRDAVARQLGWVYSGPPVRIVVVEDYDRMREETRAQVPRWAVGVALSTRALIVIRADLLAAGFGGGIVPVLRHEWVHLAWGQRAGEHRRVLPLWVEEGLAEEIGGAVSVDAGATLDLAVAFDRLHDFEDLRQGFPAEPRAADLAYKQSRSWVRYVLQRAGWPAFQALLADLADHGESAGRGEPGLDPFARAVRLHTGRSLAAWLAGWRVALDEDAAPWFHLLLRDFQGLILTCLAIVGLGAFFLVLRRRRRQIRALPDEEGSEIHGIEG